MNHASSQDGKPGEDVGLRCPNCNCRDLRVDYTRRRSHNRIIRRRVCRHCGRRISTVERIAGA